MKKLLLLATSFLVIDASALASSPAKVVRVVDGDTVIVASPKSKEERVRLLGIDAPEVEHPGVPNMPQPECGGDRATTMLSSALNAGEDVLLVRHGKDRYGRTLAFVYLQLQSLDFASASDGRKRLLTNSVNLWMVANGYARVERRWKFPHEATYLRYEATAKRRSYGSWGSCSEAPWR